MKKIFGIFLSLFFLLVLFLTPSFSGWEELVRISDDNALSFVPTIGVDGTGNVWVFWVDRRTSPSKIFYRTYDTGNSAWSAETPLTLDDNYLGDDANLACYVTFDRKVFLIWEDRYKGNQHLRYNIYTPEEGWIYSGLGCELVSGTSYTLHNYPAVAIGNNGAVHLVWFLQASSSCIYYMKYTSDGGWTCPISISDETGDDIWIPKICCDSMGNPHVVWASEYGMGVYYNYSDNNGHTWGDQEKISDTGKKVDISISYNNCTFYNDRIFVAWVRNGCNVMCSKGINSQEWSEITTISTAWGAYHGNYDTNIVSDRDNNVYLAMSGYNSKLEGSVFFRKQVEGVWQDEIELPLELKHPNDVGLGTVDMVRWVGGDLHIVWIDHREGNGEIYYIKGNHETIDDRGEGDSDIDGDVDGSDLVIFASDFGRTDCDQGEPCEGDLDGNGNVDGIDLSIFAPDFGRTDCPH